MYVAVACRIMTCSISKGFVTYHGSMECEINYKLQLLSEHQVLFGLRVKWPEHKSDCTGLKDELSCMSFSPYAFTACTGTVLPSLGIIVHSACKKLEIPCFFDEVDISAIFYLIHV